MNKESTLKGNTLLLGSLSFPFIENPYCQCGINTFDNYMCVIWSLVFPQKVDLFGFQLGPSTGRPQLSVRSMSRKT